MGIKKGRCPNIDGCSKAMSDEIIEIDELDDFVCPECGHELEELKKPNKNKKKPLIPIIIALVVIGSIAASLIIVFGGDEKPEVTPVLAPPVVDSISNDVSNRNDTLVIKVEESVASTADDTIKDISEKIIEKHPEVTKSQKKQTQTVQETKVSSSSHKLSYGTWTGGWKNGQPHGTGTLTYSASHLIDSRDSKSRNAQPGEYIVGEWDNGHLVQGRWFKKDGSKEAIIIGKVG